ncbi:MAG: DUF882 domain-containing protein [Rhodospirillaceae bacterium]
MTDRNSASREDTLVSRRNFLRVGAGAAATVALVDPIQALASFGNDGFGLGSSVRRLSLINGATHEEVTVDYWVKGRYVLDALRTVSQLLRDRHDGSIHAIDPRLVDVMFGIFRMTGTCSPVQVVCGYRSPRTNARLRVHHRGVASHSLHMQGKAVDIRMNGCGLGSLHQAALSLRAGGVGYYPHSNFVHVDTGPIRTWGGGSHHHYSEEDIGEAPVWRDALLTETPEVRQAAEAGLLPPQNEPAPVMDAVMPRRRLFSQSAEAVSTPVPGHKPMRVAMRDPAPIQSESFLLRRKPQLVGGR